MAAPRRTNGRIISAPTVEEGLKLHRRGELCSPERLRDLKDYVVGVENSDEFTAQRCAFAEALNFFEIDDPQDFDKSNGRFVNRPYRSERLQSIVGDAVISYKI